MKVQIQEEEYKRLKAIESAHLRAVEVQSKWRANCAVNGMGIYLELLNELRGALMYQQPSIVENAHPKINRMNK
jgi:hypothetical protein